MQPPASAKAQARAQMLRSGGHVQRQSIQSNPRRRGCRQLVLATHTVSRHPSSIGSSASTWLRSPGLSPWIPSLDVAHAPFTEHELCDVSGAISTRVATARRQQLTDRADVPRHLRVLADRYSIVQLNQGAIKRDQNRRNLAERGDYLTRAPGYRDHFTRQRGILTLGRHV
jgi:hypothetical protein